MSAVPFLVHFALPVLASMSDADAAVRAAAARAFARLVRLMPLDNGAAAACGEGVKSTDSTAATNGGVRTKDTIVEKNGTSETCNGVANMPAPVDGPQTTTSSSTSSMLDSLVHSLVVDADAVLKFDEAIDAEKLLQGAKVEDRKFLDQLLQPKTIPDAKLDFEILSKERGF